MPPMGQRPQMQRYLEEHEVNTAAPDSGFVGAWGGGSPDGDSQNGCYTVEHPIEKGWFRGTSTLESPHIGKPSTKNGT